MALVHDPVGSGLVTSLANPDGNVTGLSMMTTVDLNSKRLQVLQEIIPGLTRAAVIWNPDHPLHGKAVADLKVIAPRLSIDLDFFAVRSPDQFAPALTEVERKNDQALYM